MLAGHLLHLRQLHPRWPLQALRQLSSSPLR